MYEKALGEWANLADSRGHDATPRRASDIRAPLETHGARLRRPVCAAHGARVQGTVAVAGLRSQGRPAVTPLLSAGRVSGCPMGYPPVPHAGSLARIECTFHLGEFRRRWSVRHQVTAQPTLEPAPHRAQRFPG